MLFLIVKFIEDTTSSIFAPNDAPVLDAFRCTVLLYRFTDVPPVIDNPFNVSDEFKLGAFKFPIRLLYIFVCDPPVTEIPLPPPPVPVPRKPHILFLNMFTMVDADELIPVITADAVMSEIVLLLIFAFSDLFSIPVILALRDIC